MSHVYEYVVFVDLIQWKSWSIRILRGSTVFNSAHDTSLNFSFNNHSIQCATRGKTFFQRNFQRLGTWKTSKVLKTEFHSILFSFEEWVGEFKKIFSLSRMKHAKWTLSHHVSDMEKICCIVQIHRAVEGEGQTTNFSNHASHRPSYGKYFFSSLWVHGWWIFCMASFVGESQVTPLKQAKQGRLGGRGTLSARHIFFSSPCMMTSSSESVRPVLVSEGSHRSDFNKEWFLSEKQKHILRYFSRQSLLLRKNGVWYIEIMSFIQFHLDCIRWPPTSRNGWCITSTFCLVVGHKSGKMRLQWLCFAAASNSTTLFRLQKLLHSHDSFFLSRCICDRIGQRLCVHCVYK